MLHSEFKAEEQKSDIARYELNSLEKDKDGRYATPNMPCGILPFYINDNNEIFWGCVETNRVGVTVTTPPAGTQDIIAISDDGTKLKLEATKPIPKTEHSFLKEHEGKAFSGQNFHNIVACLIENGFHVFVESPLVTAEHETFEEHGVDLRKDIGKHLSSLVDLYEFQPQTIAAKRGTTTQKIFVAHLSENIGIELSHTDKIEEKIAINRGRKFYERGIWGTLGEFKINLAQARLNAEMENMNDSSGLSKEQKELITAELNAFESRLQLLEKLEKTISSHLNEKGYIIKSAAQAEKLEFSILPGCRANSSHEAFYSRGILNQHGQSSSGSSASKNDESSSPRASKSPMMSMSNID